VDELLALIGQHWRLVLIYPGGLTTLGLLLLLIRLDRGARREPLQLSALAAAAIWLLTISLLPLPQAGWTYDLDLATLLLAIELPFWLHTLHTARRFPLATPPSEALLAPPLNVYPLLALACAALAQAAGSLVVHEINRSSGLLHWIGLGAWSLALPPLLQLGPWRIGSAGALLQLRRLAHLGLLLAAALPAHAATPITSAAVGFAALGLPLAALDRWWRADGARWIGWQPWLAGGLLLLLAWISGQQLAGRVG
jgi:hypothetical protein